jgi:hypothetical protein
MALSSETLRRVISKTADEIVKAAKRPSQNSPRRKIVWGTVKDFESGDTTLTITLAGGDVTGIAYLNWYSPTNEDYVMCERQGTDLVCYGTLAS